MAFTCEYEQWLWNMDMQNGYGKGTSKINKEYGYGFINSFYL